MSENTGPIFIYDTDRNRLMTSLQYERLAIELMCVDTPQSHQHLVVELTECGCPIDDAIAISNTIFDQFDLRINYTSTDIHIDSETIEQLDRHTNEII